jgi:hypothetical protein
MLLESSMDSGFHTGQGDTHLLGRSLLRQPLEFDERDRVPIVL